MFTTLMESRAPQTRRVGSTLLSALTHGALIAAAVALTMPQRGDAKAEPPVPPVTYIPIDHPPQPASPQPRAPSAPNAPQRDEVPTLPAIPVAPVLWNGPQPTVDVDPAPVITDMGDGLSHSGVSGIVPFGNGSGAPTGGGAWSANQVDRAPSIAGRAVEPRYPGQLRNAGIEGRAVLQFVVDTLGRAEVDEVTVVETTHSQFAEAAREALPRFRFTPGEASGRKVRTRVQIPFNFTINR